MVERYYHVVHVESDETVVATPFEERARAEAVAAALNDVSDAGDLGRPYGVK